MLADLSELLGEAGFNIIAYRRAATRIRDTPASVAQLAVAGKAKELPGIGATIEQKIVEVVEDGEMHALARRRERVPGDVPLFMRLPGLGPKTAARIWSELGITTLAGLREAAEAQQLRVLPGFGARTEEKVLRALEDGAGDREPRVACSAPDSPSCASWWKSCALIRPQIASPRRAVCDGGARASAIST